MIFFFFGLSAFASAFAGATDAAAGAGITTGLAASTGFATSTGLGGSTGLATSAGLAGSAGLGGSTGLAAGGASAFTAGAGTDALFCISAMAWFLTVSNFCISATCFSNIAVRSLASFTVFSRAVASSSSALSFSFMALLSEALPLLAVSLLESLTTSCGPLAAGADLSSAGAAILPPVAWLLLPSLAGADSETMPASLLR